MRFQSTWQLDARDGIAVDPENGTHSPLWEELDKDTQNVIVEASSAAEGVVSELAGKVDKKGPAVPFVVQISGFVSEDDTTPSSVATSIDQGKGTWEN
jgi:hypothetical protein